MSGTQYDSSKLKIYWYLFYNIMYLLQVSTISITDDFIQFISPIFTLYNVIKF